MKHVICSVYDKAVDAYMRPFFCKTEGEAVRMFEDICLDDTQPLGKHPEDYSLYRIGVFDDHSAVLESCDPVCLRRAHEIESGVIQFGGVSNA